MTELTSYFEVAAARIGMHHRTAFYIHGVGDLTDTDLQRSAIDLAQWANR